MRQLQINGRTIAGSNDFSAAPPFFSTSTQQAKDNMTILKFFHWISAADELSNIRILTPSFVAKNKRFDVIVRFEDEFGNLTNQCS